MDQISDPPEDDPEAALRWLIEQLHAENWNDLAKALLLIRQHGGFGRISLVVRDGQVCDHPKVELSL